MLSRRCLGFISTIVCLLATGCAAHSERDTYSYDGIASDEIAQDEYLIDQTFLIDSDALGAKGAQVTRWVVLQTAQICDQLASGTSFEELAQFFANTFGDVVTDAERFVGNAAGYSCSGLLN